MSHNAPLAYAPRLTQNFGRKATTILTQGDHNVFDQILEVRWSDPLLFTLDYKNIGKVTTQGVEVSTTYQPFDNLMLRAAYTYTEKKDHTTGRDLLRRPKNKLSADINYSFMGKANVNLSLVYVGKRSDITFDQNTFTEQTIALKDYILINLAASYDVIKNLQLFGRIENMLDQRYQEVYGHNAPGIGAYGGIQVSF